MVIADIWLNKIQSFLHDPPGKSLDIKGHEKLAKNIAQTLGINLSRDAYQQADWIASAADRLNFPSYRQIGGADFRNHPYLTHPLSGNSLELVKGQFLPTQINESEIYQAIEKSLQKIPDRLKQDHQKLFLWLWRNWSSKIQQIEGNQLGFFWDLLPADTRIPDHSIWTHQALTSAIATALPNPAFLLFTLGPVQAFISAARKTQDLWAGSYLLSYLNWTAIEVVAEAIGPDAIIFPNLLEQPLCDRWLASKGIISQPPGEDLILSSLPNRFFAIVPEDLGKTLAEKAEFKLRSQWREITQAVRLDLEDTLDYSPNWAQTWERQTENFFEVYWQVYPWRPNNEPIKDNNFENFLVSHKPYLGDRYEKIKNILEVYAKPDARGGGQYQPNLGAIYQELYFITEKALGSRKGLRNFSQVEEIGEKSTLGGDRATLYHNIDAANLSENNFDRQGRQNIIKFWKKLAKKLQQTGRFEIQETGQERLDAVELTKRCAWRSYLQKQLNITNEIESEEKDKVIEEMTLEYELRFPSTSSIATASFRKDILEKCHSQNGEALRQAIKFWLQEIKKCPSLYQGNRVLTNVIPYLSSQVAESDSLLKSFLGFDGRLFFEETYQEAINHSENEADKLKIKAALKKLRYLFNVASREPYKISKPKKYFAVLMMDGDSMGQWISGEKMPEYELILHPDTLKQLKKLPDWQGILKTKRLMSPAIHGFVSKALGDFSLKLVRYIVEEINPGKLIYAGGDDVLALLPLDCALETARLLRAAFSGEIITNTKGEDLKVSFGNNKSGYIWLKLSQETKASLLTTMGCKAAASTGIAIAHHTQPLDLTLNAVRDAEKKAKDVGRDRFNLTFLKRSGEIMQAGAKWTYQEKTIDTINLLLEFQQRFSNHRISGKFPYVLRTEAETITGFNLEKYSYEWLENLYSAEVKRLLKRQQGKELISQQEIAELSQNFTKLVIQAERERETSGSSGKELKNFANLLVFTRSRETPLVTGIEPLVQNPKKSPFS
ncbi:type III-B CRISPR-associated protein Cas10/Cmr2 [Pleurocapsales cyanobacterium LEGE 06147]|nr:type III-B CRISPR-associated protein Cas10/Cmr2 [Pleurocapsales cyanobacterium LEGE 06147]